MWKTSNRAFITFNVGRCDAMKSLHFQRACKLKYLIVHTQNPNYKHTKASQIDMTDA
jgi:hypothetical protein